MSPPGDRNQGMQLVLVDTARFEDEGGPTRLGQSATPRQRQVFVAIPSSHFIKGLTEEQFRTMLDKRGWPPDTTVACTSSTST